MAIVETFFRNSNFVVLLLLLLLLLLLSQLFANLSETQPNPFRIYQKPKTMENLSDTYHDPSYKVPKKYYWNADPPYFLKKNTLFRGGIYY